MQATCSDNNIRDLHKSEIPFLIRLPNNDLAKKLIEERGTDVCDAEYAMEYGKRLLFMKRVPAKLYECDCYAYLAVDFIQISVERERY
jgi:hypothetical protein